MGCGFALTSFFISNETDADTMYAYDLWIPASENYMRIRDNGLEDKIIPIHRDAMDMPFAHDYFDVIVSVDAYHYFGCREGVFAEDQFYFLRGKVTAFLHQAFQAFFESCPLPMIQTDGMDCANQQINLIPHIGKGHLIV